MIALRWAAIAMAVAALVEPRVALPYRARPGVRLIADAHSTLGARVQSAGFPLAAANEAATLVTADSGAAPQTLHGPVFLLDAERLVNIRRVSASSTRLPGQAATVLAVLHAHGARGLRTTVQLEEAGVPVATATHTWGANDEDWEASVVAPSVRPDAALLRVRATTNGMADAATTALVSVPPTRAPVPVLVFDPAVTWGSAFVRRALEDHPAFNVDSLARSTTTAATRAGGSPAALSRAELAPYDVLVCGGLDGIDAAGVEAIRWFVEARGGVFVLLPPRVPDRPFATLLPGLTFESRTLDAPIALSGVVDGLSASDLAVPRAALPMTTALATDAAGAPVVVAIRRGLGAVLVSGALDAWRYRDRADGAFGRFWAAALMTAAAAVPPRLEIVAAPDVPRPGDAVHVRVRLRGTELAASGDRVLVPPMEVHAVDGETRADTLVRMWPSAEPGLYQGEWRPVSTGRYRVAARVGDASGSVIVQASDEAAAPSAAALRVVAQASGGGVFTDESALVQTLSERLAAVTQQRYVRPSRSPWWALAFAACLCVDWVARRRRGQA